MPLFLTSQVVESVINISRYFEETSQFVWMFEMLMEVYKGCEKEDEVLWSHLIYGIFVAASNHTIVNSILLFLLFFTSLFNGFKRNRNLWHN